MINWWLLISLNKNELIYNNIMSKCSNEQTLSNIYYDLERGYGSAKSLYEQAEEAGAVITLEEVKNLMKKQPNKQES